MAKEIKQRITLDGGQEFRAGLKALGQAGQEAFKNVQDGAKQATITAAQMAPVIDAIQKKFKELRNAAREVGTSFTEVGSRIKAAGTRITEFAAVATGAAVGLGMIVKGSADAADEAGKTAAALGMTVQELQNMEYAAGASNMTNEQLQKGLLKIASSANASEKRAIEMRNAQRELQYQLTQNNITFAEYQEGMRKLNNSNVEAIDPFNRLRISLYDMNNKMKTPKKLTDDLADAFKRSTDEALKLGIATEIIGTRQAKPFMDFLNQGSDGIHRLMQEGQRLAPAFSAAEVEIGQKFGDTLDSLGRTIDSIKNKFFLLFGPSLVVLMKQFQQFLANNAAAVQTFGEQIAGALRPVFSDLGKLLSGQELNPEGLVAKVRDAVVSTIANVKEAFGIIKSVWDGLVSTLDAIANIINSIFGTQLKGQAIAIALAFGAVTGVLSAIFAAITAIGTVIGLLAAAFGGVEVAIVAAGTAVGYYFGSKLIEDIKQAPDMLVALWNTVKDAFYDMGVGVKVIWNAVVGFLYDRFKGFIDELFSEFASLKKFISSIPGIGTFFGGGNSQGFAEGGQVRGPGTDTSDSIMARLSNNEFVIQARAVKHYGAGLFDALNNMRIPSPGFALGGLVDAVTSVLPRTNFATGGMVAAPAVSGRPVILQIGGDSFGPLTAGEHTVNRLERYAANQQLRSAGRKPTWAGK